MLSMTCFVIMDFSEISKVKSKMWDEMRSPFRAKRINDSMFMDDFNNDVCDVYITSRLLHNDNMFVSHLCPDNRYYLV